MTPTKSLKTLAASAVAALCLGAASQVSAGSILGAVSATINSGGPGFGDIAETYNQAGLSSGYISGLTDYDTYIAGSPLHTLVFAGNEWFSNQGSTAASVTYNLGAAKTVNAFSLWNEEASGIALFDLLYSTDGLNFNALLTGVAPTDSVNNADYGPQSFTFTSVTAQYFRLDASNCPQIPAGFDSCAIGEVAWREGQTTSVPEPSSLALVGLALAGGALVRRRNG